MSRVSNQNDLSSNVACAAHESKMDCIKFHKFQHLISHRAFDFKAQNYGESWHLWRETVGLMVNCKDLASRFFRGQGKRS
jgi:hypothetical protein